MNIFSGGAVWWRKGGDGVWILSWDEQELERNGVPVVYRGILVIFNRATLEQL